MFFYDPIQRAIDIQLSRFGPRNPEDLINKCLDLKYYPREHRQELVEYLTLEGYTQQDIANTLGYSQQTISRILRSG